MLLAGDGEISWVAHVGGIVAGALLVLVLRRRGVPLFDRGIARAATKDDEMQTPSAAAPSPWGRR